MFWRTLVEPEELRPAIDQAYKTVAEQISVPGFRMGKVPAAIIDQRIELVRGEAMIAETVELEEQRFLKTLGQSREALASLNGFDILPAAVGQPEMIKAMGERLAGGNGAIALLQPKPRSIVPVAAE